MGLADQSISSTTLRHAWDKSTRHGRNLAAELREAGDPDPLLGRILRNQRQTRNERSYLKRIRAAGAPPVLVEASQKRIIAMASSRRAHEDEYLERIHENIAVRRFRLQLVWSFDTKRHQYYTLAGPPGESFFASQNIQRAIARAFDFRSVDRDSVVDGVARALDDTMPKTVVRADIQSFYESIPHRQLLDVLAQRNRLDSHTLSLVKDLLRQFTNISPRKLPVGLPRGIGVSSYLAEAYLQSFDAEIRSLPGTFFYARYVDDVVAVFSAPPAIPHIDNLEALQSRLDNLGLTLSKQRHKRFEAEFDLKTRTLVPFEYLGYSFRVDERGVRLKLSKKRYEKLRNRLLKAFAVYQASAKSTGMSAKWLAARVAFLTSSTRLHHSKRNAFIGVYLTNKFLNDETQLLTLDRILARESKTVDASLCSRLGTFSFVSGFKEKKFRSWSSLDLARIAEIWSPHD